MRMIQYIIAAIAIAVVVSAKPHRLHRQVHPYSPVKRGVADAPVATETQIVYWLNDHAISEEEVREGITNGTLIWGPGNVLLTTPAAPVAAFTAPPISDGTQTAELTSDSASDDKTQDEAFAIDMIETVATSQSEPDGHVAEVLPNNIAPPDASNIQLSDTSSSVWAGRLVDKNGHCDECDREFPDGLIPCTQFPHGYGAFPITHEGLGGWSGIQEPQYVGSDGFDDIKTVASGSCSDGTCCTPGSYCSYGCPNPYLKASFPSVQGRHGQTVGGLYCNKAGYLEMADGKIANTLCVQGSTHMYVKVQNNLSQTVSFCRTDYPGTESMTFPVTVRPGQTGFLANPDQLKYFFWEGRRTSAQYYVNKQGVPESEACTWGKEMGGKGNWAPAVFGTSYDDGPMQQGFSSLKQNELCKEERLGYDITFTGDGVISACRYKSASNQWCEGDQCWEDPNRGCTAAIIHGDLTIILSEGS
ncbi:glycoside hydrolase family 132 protein [Curvularia clavata]|uniref:Glycoside hydrolase family 132 protein n=1 Tax=Curvularia clavata TaxID=95742 RepID=A0A9Q9DTP2_CURCL|nr:glycoside hydrolase family 132 protein [Curvularia clavata]